MPKEFETGGGFATEFEGPDRVRFGSPGQDYPIIVREPYVAGAVLMRARRGLIPRWMKDANAGPRPINACVPRPHRVRDRAVRL